MGGDETLPSFLNEKGKMGKKIEKEILATIRGTEDAFDIKANTLYKVVGRYDDSAPDGLKRAGISKIPFMGNGERILCRFDEVSDIYDTGFYPSSKCYANVSYKEAEALANKAYKNIAEPFARMTSKDINQSNFEFWDDFIVPISDDEVTFNTSNPVDAFKLYIAVLSRKLCPDELDGDPRYKESFYRVIDTSTTKAANNEFELDTMRATAGFVTLLNGSEDASQGAKDIAIWLGFYDGSDVSSEYILLAFNNYLKEDPSNVRSYFRAYGMYNDPKESEILKICRMLSVLAMRGVTDSTKRGLMLGGKVIGKDRKTIADLCINDSSYAKTRVAIIEAYETLFDEEVGDESKNK